VNENLTELRAERCATRHISGLSQPEFCILCRFHSTRIEREAGAANAFEDVAFSRKHCGSSAFASTSRDEAKE